MSEGTLEPSVVLGKMLDALRELSPAAHQQVTMPGAGFALIPGDALGDEQHEWWNSEAATTAVRSIAEALNEHAPAGFAFQVKGEAFGFFPFDAASDALEMLWMGPDTEPAAMLPGQEPYSTDEQRALDLLISSAAEADESIAPEELEEHARVRRRNQLVGELGKRSFTSGTTPHMVVAHHAKSTCGAESFLPLYLPNALEWQAVERAVALGCTGENPSIDPFSLSRFEPGARRAQVHVEELPYLVRRLWELFESWDGQGVVDSQRANAALKVRASIIESLGIDEV